MTSRIHRRTRRAWIVALAGLAVAAAALAGDRLVDPASSIGYKWGLLMAAGLVVAAVAAGWELAGPLGRRGALLARDAVTPRRTVSDPVVLAITAATLAAQVLYAFLAEPLFDQDDYRRLGLDFANYWQTAEQALTMRTPGYPLFLAANYELGLGDTAVKVSQALVIVAMQLATATLAGLAAGRTAARVTTAGVALYLPLWAYSAVGMTEALSITATALSALAAVLAHRRPEQRTRWVLACGLFGSVAVIVRPNTLLYFFVFAVALMIASGSLRRAAATAALIALPVAALFGPWIARNVSHDAGLKPFGTNGSYPLALGVHLPYDDEIGEFSPLARSYRFFTGTRPDGFTPTAAAASEPWEELRHNITHEPLAFAWSRAVAQFQLWAWPITPKVSSGSHDVVPYPLLMALHLAILAAGIAGLIALRGTLIGWIGIACLVITVANHLVYWTTPRYALPTFPFLLVGAGVLIAGLRQRTERTAEPTTVVRAGATSATAP